MSGEAYLRRRLFQTPRREGLSGGPSGSFLCLRRLFFSSAVLPSRPETRSATEASVGSHVDQDVLHLFPNMPDETSEASPQTVEQPIVALPSRAASYASRGLARETPAWRPELLQCFTETRLICPVLGTCRRPVGQGGVVLTDFRGEAPGCHSNP